MDVKPSKKNENMNFLRFSSLGFHLTLCTAAGIGIGYALDKWLKTSPVFLMIFFVMGILAGFLDMYRELKKSNAN